MKNRLGRRIGVALLSVVLLTQEIALPAWASESVSGTNDTALVEIVDQEGDILTDVSDGNPVLVDADNQPEDAWTEEVYEELSTATVKAVVYQDGALKVPLLGNADTGAESGIEAAIEAPVSMDTIVEVEEYMYEQLKGYSTSIDISSYNIPVSCKDGLISGVINEHPDLYDVDTSNVVCSYNPSTNCIISFQGIQYIQNMDSVAFNRAVTRAMEKISDSSLTDMQKAIILHDYLAIQVEYDNTTSNCYSAFGALAEGKAVCQGYALAYKYLLNKAGIDCYMVTSESLNHAWNLVEINGNYYHVDVTWDDPTPDLLGRSRHFFMFCSDDAFNADKDNSIFEDNSYWEINPSNTDLGGRGHKASDWEVTRYGFLVSANATDKTYDNYFWSLVNAPIVMDGSDFYYITNAGALVKGTATGTVSNTLVSSLGWWDQWAASGWHMSANASGLFRLGDYLFYNKADGIYRINLDGSDPRIMYSMDTTQGYVYGIAQQLLPADDRTMLYYILTTTETVTGSQYIHDFAIDGDGEPDPGGGGGTNPDKPSYVAAPTITINGRYQDLGNGSYLLDKGTTVTLNADSAATVYYSTNGEDPFGQNTYTGPITISATISVKIVANISGVSSDVVSCRFVVASELVMSESIEVLVDGSESISITSNPTNPKSDISWSSDNEAVATVDSTGKVTGVSAGTATITATFYDWNNDKVEKQCAVTVIGAEEGKFVVRFGFYNYKHEWVTWETQQVEAGQDATLPASKPNLTTTPKLECYNAYYVGDWGTNYKNVQKNEDVALTLTPKTYTITYNLYDGTNNSANPDTYDVETLVELQPAVKSGYRFEGWYTSSSFAANTVVESFGYGRYGNKTIHAKFVEDPDAPVTYFINYNLNGGTNSASNPTTYTNTMTSDIILEDPTRTGYEFTGWYESSSCSGTPITTIAQGSTGDKTLYAGWKAISYTITYNLNGGSVSGNPTTYTIESDDITLNNPTKSGYTFAGWYENEDCTGAKVTTIAKGSTGNKTFWAKWTTESYTITYNLNGGTNAADNPTSYTADTGDIILKNPTRTGYEFTGWYENSSCTGDAVTKIAQGSTGNKTFYAGWKVITYNITYYLNGGSVSGNPATYTIETNSITLQNPTRDGYEFTGWYENSSCTGTPVTKIAQGSTGDKTFYAGWKIITYQITYNLNGGSVSGNPATYTIETAEITLINPIRDGYEFTGWYENSSCTGTPVTKIAQGSTGDKTFYAGWKAINYTITYNLNGGSNAAGNPGTYTIEDSVTLKDPTRTGFVFTGWYESEDCTGAKVTTIAKGSTGNKTFWAGWEENPVEYTVTFKGRDGKVLKTEKVFAGKDATPPEAPAITGYDFMGWSDSYTNIQSDKTITAEYTLHSYTISYILNGGANNGGNPGSYTIESEDITLNAATGKTGYTFVGWYDNAELSGTPVTVIKKGSTGDVILYAKWSENFYKVTFVGFNNVVIREDQVKEGGSATPPAIPEIPGYTANGWNGNYSNVTKDEIVTAKYNVITYYITYITNGGSGTGGNPETYNVESLINLNAPGERAGYTFAGWYDNAEFTGNPITEIAKGTIGNLILHARWKNEKGLWLKWKGLAEDAELSTPYTGLAIKPEFEVYVGDTLLVPGVDYTVAYKNNTNANILSTDAEKAKAPSVIITGKGNYAGKVTKTFKITPKNIDDADVNVAMPALSYNGKVQKGVPVVVWGTKKLTAKKDFIVTYPQESDAIAYKNAGYYQVVITGNGNYTGTIYTTEIIVDEKSNPETRVLNKAKAASIPAFTYNGNAVNLEEAGVPVVKYGKETLVCGTDFELEYNRSATEIGIYPVIIRGKGNYSGAIFTTFQIKGISASTMKVDRIAVQTYSGGALTPVPVIKDAKGNELTPGVHYTLSYANNVNVGNGQIIITGKGEYTGTKKVTFSIKALPLDEIPEDKLTIRFATGSDTHAFVKGGVKPKLVIVYNGVTLKEGTDYSLSYKNNTVISENSTKIPTVIITGKKNFSKSLTKEFIITKADLSQVTMTANDMQYNATPGKYMSTPVLTDTDGKKLAKGKDYEATYEYYDINGNKMDAKSTPAVGDVIKVKVTGKGNYEGTKETTYRIYAKGYSIASAKITVLNKKYYNGDPVVLTKADLKVQLGKDTLGSEDYEIVSYSNNVIKGTAKVTIRGVGNYAGTKTFNLPIQAQQLIWWTK
ncbi:MAG: InlB B-repeat-containing protein [Lachnospiraceae bacterium]